jgi:hypothetical protein
MKKQLAGLITVAVIAAVAVGGVSANSDGTVVASGFKCFVYDGNGALVFTNTSNLTVYQNKVVLQCSGFGAGARPGPIYFNITNKPAVCVMRQFGPTTNWSDKVGFNGNSQLTCTKAITNESTSESEDAGIVE